LTRITRYFLIEFIKPALFSLASLAILIMVSELMEHLEKFISGKASVRLVLDYLVSILPMRFTEILPVALLLATLFALGNLSRRQEITAAMSGGIHPWACVKPLLVCGVFVSLASWAIAEWVVPDANAHAKALWKMEVRHYAFLRQTRFDQLTVGGRGGVFYAIGTLESDKDRMQNVAVDFFQNGHIVKQLQAREALWKDGQWTFVDGVERHFNSTMDLTEQKPFDSQIVELQEKPSDLVPQEPDADEMSYSEYKHHLDRLKSLGVPTRRQQVDLYIKIAFPWANFIVLLLGIPFAFQKTGGKVKAIGLALGVAFLYFGLMQVGRALGQKSWCNPMFGAWLANLVFLVYGGWMFLRMRKLA
jgi:lipopolysaccharide export system permease protein